MSKKFFENETYIIEKALELYLEAVVKQIGEAENNGKRPIFTKQYFETIVPQLAGKVKSMTYKSKK
jgi:hypothetical protein